MNTTTAVPRRRTRLRHTSIALAATTALAGCTMLNPYEHSQMLDAALDADAGGAQQADALQLAGGAASGLAEAERLRLAYFDKLQGTAQLRAVTGAGAVALGGWTLYNALKPNEAGAGQAPADTRRSVRLSAALASLYALRELFVNPGQEKAYAEGYRALTCLMLQSGPLLMTERRAPARVAGAAAIQATETQRPIAASGAMSFSASPLAGASGFEQHPYNAEAASPQPYALAVDGSLGALRGALDRLELRILHVSMRVASIEASHVMATQQNPAMTTAFKPLDWQLRDSRRALAVARNALYDGRTLVRTIEGAGREIRSRVGLVAAAVNEQSRDAQNDLKPAGDLLKDAQDISSAIMNIGNNAAADQAAINASADVAAANVPGAAQRVFASWTVQQAPTFVPVTYAVAQQAAIAGLAAAGSRARTAVSPAASAASAPRPPASPPLTLAEMETLRDQLNTSIKATTARIAAAEAKAKQEADTAALTKIVEQLKADKPSMLACGRTADNGGCASLLAEDVELLYAARRPVVQELFNFRAVARRAADTPICTELAPLRVTPNDVVRARPGDTITYVVSQRAPANPFALMHGPTDPDTGATFALAPQSGTSLHVASVKIGAKMPEQTLRLVFADSKGIASQTMSIVVGKALPPIRPASAPAGRANSATTASKASSEGRLAAMQLPG